MAGGDAEGDEGGLEDVGGEANGKGRGVEEDFDRGDVFPEEFFNDGGAQAGDEGEAVAGADEGAQCGAQGVDGALGGLLEEGGVGGCEAALDVGNVNRGREQRCKGLGHGFAVNLAHEAVGVVVGHAILR